MKKRRIFSILTIMLISLFMGINGASAFFKGNFVFKLKQSSDAQFAKKVTRGKDKIYMKSIPKSIYAYEDEDRTQRIDRVPVPYRKGYGFNGYFVKENGKDKKLISRRGAIKQKEMIDYIKGQDKFSSRTLTAKWNKLKYRMELKVDVPIKNKATYGSVSGATNYVRFAQLIEGVGYNEAGMQIDNIYVPVPTDNDIVFAGYYADINGKKMQVIDEDGKLLRQPFTSLIASNYKQLNANGYRVEKGMIALKKLGKSKITVTAKFDKKSNRYVTSSTIKLNVGETRNVSDSFAGTTCTPEDTSIATIESGIITALSEGTTNVKCTDSKGDLTGEFPIKVVDPNAKEEDEEVTPTPSDGSGNTSGEETTPAEGESESEGDSTDSSASAQTIIVKNTEEIKFTTSQANYVLTSTSGQYSLVSEDESIVKPNGTGSTIVEAVKVGTTNVSLVANGQTIETVKVNVVTAKATDPVVICYMKDNTVKPNQTKKFKYEIINNANNRKPHFSLVNGTKGSNANVVKNKKLKFNKKTMKITGITDNSETVIKVTFNANSTEGEVVRKCNVLVSSKLTKKQKKNIKADTTSNNLKKQSNNLANSDLSISGGSSSGSNAGSGVAVKKLKISQSKAKLKVNESATFKFKATPAKADTSNVVWSSSKPAVAEVDQSGIVTGKKKGTAVIKVSVGKKVAKKRVTITAKSGNASTNKNKKLSINCPKTTIKVGGKVNCNATGGNGTKKWKSANPKIASVNNKGVVKGKKKGSAAIKVTSGGKTKTIRITVKKK